MFAPKQTALELLRLGTIRRILQSAGPCITIALAPYHPGEASGSAAAQLHSHLQNLAEQLAKHNVQPAVAAELLAPLRRLAESQELAGGSHWGRVIFRAPAALEQFHLAAPAQARAAVGSVFSVRSIAAELARPQAFYILNLSQTAVSLWRCAGLHAERVKLPKGVPETLEDALEFRAPDHTLENRSAVGSAAGARRRVRFGTGSIRETEHTYLADYYKLVSRGLRQFLRESDIPVVLAGVEEDCAIFRAAGDNLNLAKGALAGGQNALLDDAELLRRAYAILAAEDLEGQASYLKASIERLSPSRVAANPLVILEAAFSGRVDHLFVSDNAERIGVWERGNYRSWECEDLVNLAMAQTILRHGKAYSLPAALMPEGMEMAALMRY